MSQTMTQPMTPSRTRTQNRRGLTAGDVMTRDVLVASETMTVEELATFLVDHEISGAPVVDVQGRPVGVVSVADLARLAGEGWGEEAAPSRGDFFRSWGLADQELYEGGDAFGPEELEQLSFRGSEGLQITDVMSAPVQKVSEDTPVAELAALMTAGHFHRLLVVREGLLVGIVTSMDLLALLIEEPEPAQGRS